MRIRLRLRLRVTLPVTVTPLHFTRAVVTLRCCYYVTVTAHTGCTFYAFPFPIAVPRSHTRFYVAFCSPHTLDYVLRFGYYVLRYYIGLVGSYTLHFTHPLPRWVTCGWFAVYHAVTRCGLVRYFVRCCGRLDAFTHRVCGYVTLRGCHVYTRVLPPFGCLRSGSTLPLPYVHVYVWLLVCYGWIDLHVAVVTLPVPRVLRLPDLRLLILFGYVRLRLRFVATRFTTVGYCRCAHVHLRVLRFLPRYVCCYGLHLRVVHTRLLHIPVVTTVVTAFTTLHHVFTVVTFLPRLCRLLPRYALRLFTRCRCRAGYITTYVYVARFTLLHVYGTRLLYRLRLFPFVWFGWFPRSLRLVTLRWLIAGCCCYVWFS